MNILTKDLVMEPIGNLKPHPQNPRKGDLEALEESITTNGFFGAVVAQRSTGHALAGNHRLMAAAKMGAELIPVLWIDCDDSTAMRILLADNRISDLAEYQNDLLADLLLDLSQQQQGLVGTGYDCKALENLLENLGRLEGKEGLCPPDDIPEPPLEPVTKPGDLWVLETHRLLCGDSTREPDVKRVTKGELSHLMVTDPPYLIGYDGTNHPHKWGEPRDTIKKRNKDWSASYGCEWDEASQGSKLYEGFHQMALAHALTPNAAIYVWHASRRQAMLEAVWNKFKILPHQQLIWAKDRPILTRSWYMWAHEPCLMGWVQGNKPDRITEDFPSTVWCIPTVPPGVTTEHPTSKPVELFSIPLKQHTKPGDACFEPFAGSGSQVIAAEQLGRRCLAIEISPVFCDVIVRRWENFTGKKAHLE